MVYFTSKSSFNKLFLVLLLTLYSGYSAIAQITTANLFRNSYALYESMRLPNGCYRDGKVFAGADYHPISTANTGMGLVGICIATQKGWITRATGIAQVTKTLNSIRGYTTGFKMDTNAAGFPRHFLNINTGANEWNSEYSTIDTALMVCGAMFAKKYFNDGVITRLADEIYNSVNWSKAIANETTGTLYLELDAAGNGVGGTIGTYSEYMLVAYFAYRAEDGQGGPATRLWNKFYANPNSPDVPKRTYFQHTVLSDGSWLSSFIPQFCYYLNTTFINNTAYVGFLGAQKNADKLWFDNSGTHAAYEWGLGAGSANVPSGYHADRIDDNATRIVSPHIIAGFWPVNAGSITDLTNMSGAGKGIYTLNGTSTRILWRYSLTNPAWKATDIQGVDYATMLFGLAANNLGIQFFKTNNLYNLGTHNFVRPTAKGSNDTKMGISTNETVTEIVAVYPSPATDFITIDYGNDIQAVLKIQLINSEGQIVFETSKYETSKEGIDVSRFDSGVYFVRLQGDKGNVIRKIIVK